MRKLALFAIFFAAAVFLMVYIPALLPCHWLCLLPLGLLPFTVPRRFRERRLSHMLRLALLGLCLGFGWMIFWENVILREATDLTGEERWVEAEVLSAAQESRSGKQTELRVGHTRFRLYYDGLADLEIGQRVLVKAVFSRTEEKRGSDYYLSRGLPLFATALEEPEPLGPAAGQWRFFPEKLGLLLRQQLQRVFDGKTAPFLLAILTGDRSRLQQDVHFYAMLRSSGVAHCVAVSGMHLSFLASFLFFLLGRGKTAMGLCSALVLLFMAVTGFSPSVVRAGVMQIAVCMGELLRQEYDSLTALLLALLLLLLCNPYSAANAGFQLSFAATLGILLFQPGLYEKLPRMPAHWNKHGFPARLFRGAKTSLSVSLSASVFTVPLTALYFGQISLIAPLANLLVLWAVSLVFSLGLLALLCSFVWLLPASLLAVGPVTWLIGYIRFIVGILGRFPLASIYTDSLYLFLWMALGYLLLLFYRFYPGLRCRGRSFALSLLVSLAVFWCGNIWEIAQDTLRVATLDVGQGLCVVLAAKGATVVIDCGGSLSQNAGDIATEYLASIGRFRIDALILTHAHEDHVNGVAELLERVPTKAVFLPQPMDAAGKALFSLLEQRVSGITLLSKADRCIRLNELELTLIPPLGGGGENEAGLCVLAQTGGFDLLVTGDAGEETEYRLLEQRELPDLELLVAGHHGSAKSVSPKLLERCCPDVVTVSVGPNGYHLPAEETLNRIRRSGAALYRTDQRGTIELSYQNREEA